MSASSGTTLTAIAMFALLAQTATCQSGAPAAAPSLATAAQTLKAQAPATAQAISAALTGPSAACLIPANGGVLINAPIMADNPTASVARPVQQSSSHAAHVDSADGFWEDFGSVAGSLFPVVTGGIGALGYALHTNPGLPFDALPGAGELPEGAELAEIGELGTIALSTAQVDSVSLDDLQDGDVAAADASFNQVKGTALADPTVAARAGVAVGKPVVALSPGTSLTVAQNFAVLAPKPQPQAASPTALPSSVVAGLAVGKAAKENGGRKMLESPSAAPACCNSHIVKQGDTLDSIAATYGQPTNGPAILQAINGLNGTDITPGQSLMLPCGRILTYYAAFNAAASVSKTATPSSSSSSSG